MKRPSAALAKPPAPPKPPALVSASLAALEAAIGGRTALVAALSHAPKSRDLDTILGLVGDPAHARYPLADLCAKGGITAGELIEAYKSGEIARAQALALQKVGAQLDAVAADTMRRSLPQQLTCWTCDATGLVTPEPTRKRPNPQPERCGTCHGTGTITIEGDLEHKKLALEMGRLTVKSGGMQIAVQQNVNQFTGMAAGGSLEALQAATDRILWGDGALLAPEAEASVVEGEVAAVPEEEPCEVEGDWREEAR